MNDKRMYHGRLIYRENDEYGSMEVIEAQKIISLHFSTRARQSAIDLEQPSQLVLPYTRSMSAALLFQPQPRNCLLLGLGGGSLLRFINQHRPTSHITAVELRPKVISIAKEFFQLPDNSNNIKVQNAEALDFLQQNNNDTYDLIFVDLYDKNGPAPCCLEKEFFPLCLQRLSESGVLSLNMWTSRPLQLRSQLKRLYRGIKQPLHLFYASNRGNLTVIASKSPLTSPQLQQNALFLQTELGLSYPEMLANSHTFSPSLWNKIFG